jgi:rhodanese-related sulfurtransferase
LKIKWILAIVCLLASSYAAAQEFSDMTAEGIKSMIEAKKGIFIVDARGEDAFRQGHIPGAVNITPEMFSRIQDFLPKDKDAFLVFYCTGGKAG